MTNVFTSKSARIAAATPFTLMGAGAAFTAEACRVAAEKLGGEHVSKAPGYGYLAAHTTGFGKGAKAAAISALDKKLGFKVSPKVAWNGRRWVVSEAWKQEKGEQAFLLSLYKAANKLLDIHDKGANGLLAIPGYKDKDGQSHTLAMWVIRALESHIHGNKEETTEKNMKKAYQQAVVRTYLPEEDLPTYEEVLAVAQREATLSKQATEAEAKEQPRITVEEGKEILAEVEAEEQPVELGSDEKAEARDGRAPKTVPAYDIKALVRKAGVSRLKADNAYEVAEKAKAAFEAKKLTNDEFQFVVEACIAKDGGDPEEFYALMGEN